LSKENLVLYGETLSNGKLTKNFADHAKKLNVFNQIDIPVGSRYWILKD